MTTPLRRFSRLDFASFAECARINRAMSALIFMGGFGRSRCYACTLGTQCAVRKSCKALICKVLR